MKRTAMLSSILVGSIALASTAALADAAAPGSWTGWIVDSKCGAKNANANAKACVLYCVKQGAKFVLSTGADQPLLGLDDQRLASEHVGERVRVRGRKEGTTIKVEAIESASAREAHGTEHGLHR
jgi:hypothetical protein